MIVSIHDGRLIVARPDIHYKTLIDTGAFRWERRIQALVGYPTLDNLDKLADLEALPAEVEAVRTELRRRRELVDMLRNPATPLPPIKWPVHAKLYDHQARGAAMALAAFGLELP